MKNVPQVTVNECAKQLELIYSKCIEKKVSFSYVLAPFLWGPPGIGKSTVVKELGEFLSKKYHKQINLLDLRLYEYNPVDLKGIPYKDESSTFTTWLMPKILDFDRSDDVINILFLDELLSAKESVQAVGLQIVLDRKIDQYVLPDNTIVIAASNRKEDRSFTTNMSMALANRFSHYDVVSNPGEWKAYAYEKHLDPRIVAFLSFHPSYLSEDIKDAGYAFSSPRSWEKVSNLISLFDDLSEIQSSIASYIGEGTAMEFLPRLRQTLQQGVPCVRCAITQRRIRRQHDLQDYAPQI